MFITLEGIDGTGKSSAAKMLAEKLGFAFNSTPPAEYLSIRTSATSNEYSAYHYYLSSCYYISEIAGKMNLVCDRYIHSTLAYNWPYSRSGADCRSILKADCRSIPKDWHEYYENLKKPDFSFLLCASDSVRRERMLERKRKGGIISELDSDFEGQQRALNVYMKFSELIRIETDGMSLNDVVALMIEKVKHA